MWLLKGAFLAFYWCLFSRIDSRFIYLLYVASAITVSTFIVVITIHFAWCLPVHRNWTSTLEEFAEISSINSLTTLTIGTFLNVFTDFIILLLPLLIIKSFNLKRREILGLCFIFFLGLFCVAASVIRYVVMYIPYKYPPATMGGVREAFLWSTVELVVGLIAFCLPSFRAVLWDAFQRKRAKRPPPLAGSGSIVGDSDPKGTSSGRSRNRKKRLPRHPSSLSTIDFVTTLNASRDEEMSLDQLTSRYSDAEEYKPVQGNSQGMARSPTTTATTTTTTTHFPPPQGDAQAALNYYPQLPSSTNNSRHGSLNQIRPPQHLYTRSYDFQADIQQNEYPLAPIQRIYDPEA